MIFCLFYRQIQWKFFEDFHRIFSIQKKTLLIIFKRKKQKNPKLFVCHYFWKQSQQILKESANYSWLMSCPHFIYSASTSNDRYPPQQVIHSSHIRLKSFNTISILVSVEGLSSLFIYLVKGVSFEVEINCLVCFVHLDFLLNIIISMQRKKYHSFFKTQSGQMNRKSLKQLYSKDTNKNRIINPKSLAIDAFDKTICLTDVEAKTNIKQQRRLRSSSSSSKKLWVNSQKIQREDTFLKKKLVHQENFKPLNIMQHQRSKKLLTEKSNLQQEEKKKKDIIMKVLEDHRNNQPKLKIREEFNKLRIVDFTSNTFSKVVDENPRKDNSESKNQKLTDDHLEASLKISMVEDSFTKFKSSFLDDEKNRIQNSLRQSLQLELISKINEIQNKIEKKYGQQQKTNQQKIKQKYKQIESEYQIKLKQKQNQIQRNLLQQKDKIHEERQNQKKELEEMKRSLLDYGQKLNTKTKKEDVQSNTKSKKAKQETKDQPDYKIKVTEEKRPPKPSENIVTKKMKQENKDDAKTEIIKNKNQISYFQNVDDSFLSQINQIKLTNNSKLKNNIKQEKQFNPKEKSKTQEKVHQKRSEKQSQSYSVLGELQIQEDKKKKEITEKLKQNNKIDSLLTATGQVAGYCSQAFKKSKLQWRVPSLLLYRFCYDSYHEQIPTYKEAEKYKIISKEDIEKFMSENELLRDNMSKIIKAAEKKVKIEDEIKEIYSSKENQKQKLLPYIKKQVERFLYFMKKSDDLRNLQIAKCSLRMINSIFIIQKLKKNSTEIIEEDIETMSQLRTMELLKIWQQKLLQK